MARRSRARWLVPASVRVYQLLVWTYPAEFRRTYGRDMAQVFGDCCRVAYVQRGVAGVAALWLGTLGDLVASLPREYGAHLPRPWKTRAAAPAPALTPLMDASAVRDATGGQMINASTRGERWLPRLLPRIRHRLPRAAGGPRRPAFDLAHFDTFTRRARMVLSLAQEEARRLGHDYMGTEHLLLGLIREGDGLAARVLRQQGVALERVRGRVEQLIGRGDSTAVGAICLTPRLKRVIELAVAEARHLNHDYIGTEHLLLGLIREGEGIAGGVLEEMGVYLHDVREETLRMLRQVGDGS